jgi:hypothetical protein
VLFAVPPAAADVVGAHPTVPTPDGYRSPEVGRLWEGMPTDEPNTDVTARLFGRHLAGATLERMGEIVEETRPDLVISECFEFSGGLQAERLGVRRCSVAIGALDDPGFDPGPLVAELNVLRSRLGLDPATEPPWHDEPVLTWLPEILTGLPGAIRYRYEDAEGPVAEWHPVEGPADGPARHGRPRNYATLGSAAGRPAGAGAAYWAVLDALGRLDADVLFTTGARDVPAPGEVPDNVRVESYVPQAEAMRCDAVVSHGGSGTTVAALARGLPQVLVPMLADEPHNAAAVSAAGAGVTVDVRRVGEELPRAVDVVLRDASYRAAAREVAVDIRRTLDADEVFARMSAPVLT